MHNKFIPEIWREI